MKKRCRKMFFIVFTAVLFFFYNPERSCKACLYSDSAVGLTENPSVFSEDKTSGEFGTHDGYKEGIAAEKKEEAGGSENRRATLFTAAAVFTATGIAIFFTVKNRRKKGRGCSGSCGSCPGCGNF